MRTLMGHEAAEVRERCRWVEKSRKGRNQQTKRLRLREPVLV